MEISAARTRLFYPTGKEIAEIHPEYESVAWRRNEVGQARFKLAYTDDKCTRDNLKIGNRVLIQFESELPDWGGVIDVPRRRTADGIGIVAYTGERIWDWRYTGKNVSFDVQKPGSIYQSLLQQASAAYPTGIETYNIEMGGAERSQEYHHQKLLTQIVDLARLSGQDFDVFPAIINGLLVFRANWHVSRGTDKSGAVMLIDEVNVDDVQVNEQGPIANRVMAISAGQTWGDERAVEESFDLDSRDEYDYREHAEKSDATASATLQANADEILAVMKDARHKFSLVALDLQPALFVNYDIGDVVTLTTHTSFPEWSFDGKVRVVGREWRPDNTCRLQVEEE